MVSVGVWTTDGCLDHRSSIRRVHHHLACNDSTNRTLGVDTDTVNIDAVDADAVTDFVTKAEAVADFS